MKRLLLLASLPAFLMAQGGPLADADIVKPLAEQWTSYSGDFTGKRFSHLKLVNKDTVNTSASSGSTPASRPAVARQAVRLSPKPVDAAASAAAAAEARPPRPSWSAGSAMATPTTAAPRVSAAASCLSTASSTPPRPTMSTPSTPTTARSSGTTTGRPAAAPASRPAASACGTTTSTSSCTTIGWSASRPRPARKSGKGNRQLRRAVLLVERADGPRQPRDRRHRQRHGRAGLHQVLRSGHWRAAVDLLHGPDESGRPRPRNLGQPRRRPPRRRDDRGSPAPTTRRPSSTSSAPATRRPHTPPAAATATTSTPARSSP